MKLSSLVGLGSAKQMDAEDVPSDIVIDADIARYARGNRRNQFRGRIDKAGTVRVRAYIAGDANDLKGEKFTAAIDAHTNAEFVGKDSELVKLEFDNVLGDNVFVVLWAPADAELETLTINV